MVDRLRSAAKGMVEGRTHEELAKAGDDLAAAAQKVGADTWPRFLGDASHQAMEAVSRGDVPGVVKVSATDAPVGVLTFLGLLAIMTGLSRPSTSVPSRTYPSTSGPSLPPIMEAVPVPPPKEGETPTDVLKPGGQNVGEPGKNSGVRILPGGQQGARELFDRLTAGKGGQDITPLGRPGQVIRTPEGTFSIRPSSKSGPPTVDVNVPGLPLRELKFPGGGTP